MGADLQNDDFATTLAMRGNARQLRTFRVHNSPVQTYRSSIWLDVVGCVIAPLTLVASGIGLALGPGGQGDPGTDPGSIALGVVFCGVGAFFAIAQLTSRLVVNERGLTWRYFFRTKAVSWDEVEGVEVLPSGRGAYCAGIRTRSGLTAIKSVTGSERHAQTIVDAVQAVLPPPTSDVCPADAAPLAAEPGSRPSLNRTHC